MADGSIKISIEVNGKQVDIAADSLESLEASARGAGKGSKEVEDGLKGVGKESYKASGGVKQFVTALGLVKIGEAVFRTLASSMDAAISRFDTLNKFPKVLQSLGVSAEDSEKAISNLSDGIDGLPTKLDDIASNAQRMYISFKDMDKATDSALALNNAFLASGSSGEAAASGTEQYIQALQKGKPDMTEWRNMQQNMSIALERVAEQYGITTNELGEALRSGEISMTSFNDKLIELGTGTGELAELARTNSMGIATSLSNLKNAAARGIADIIDSFNKLSNKVTGKDIAENIDGLKVIVNSAFKVIGGSIEATAPLFIFFTDAVKGTIPVVEALTPAILGLVAAYAAYTVITKASAAIQAANAAIKIATASGKALTVVTQTKMAAQVASTTATKADVVATAAQTGAIKLSTLAIGLMTGTIKLGTIALIAKAAAIKAYVAVLTLTAMPIAAVVAAIGLLVAGTIAVVKWLKRSTKEGERLASQTEELANTTDELNSAVEESSKSYENNQKGIKASAETNKDLAKTIDELSKKENKSAAEKKELQSYIDELNNSVHDLNLEYGEQANALNMTSEQIQNKINLMKEEEQLIASQERLTEIMREQNEIQSELDTIIEKRKEWDEALKNNEVTNSEYGENIELLEEKEGSLSEAHTLAGEERIRVEGEIIESSKAVAEAAERDVGKQILLYENLPESVKNAVDAMKTSWEDYKASATDMFDTLSDKSETSVAEMISNLEENQRVITEWSNNIALLAERGVDEGLLETLRAAGPSSAGHVNELVNASDTELARLSEVFSKGGEVATDALVTSVGEGAEEVMNELGHMVTGMSQSLATEIKNADFESIGIDITDGLAGGIGKGTRETEKASKEMADKTTQAAKDAFQTQSPSKVFEEIGTNVTEGLVLGVSNGTSKVIDSMKKLAIDMLKSYDSTHSEYRSIGVNAMNGLNAGLNAGRARVMATARSIANSVASTMRDSLRIQSPSKVMEDDVGRWIPEGIADGIEGRASVVYNALDKMSGNMMRFSTPEAALGVNRAGLNLGSHVVNNYNSNTTNNSGIQNMQLIDALSNMKVVLEDGTLVGKLAPGMSKELKRLGDDDAFNKGVMFP